MLRVLFFAALVAIWAPAASAAVGGIGNSGLNPDNYRECTATESKGICGRTSIPNDENGFICYISYDGADDICICNESTVTFYYGAGCYCPDGWYNDPYDGEWAGCQKCPTSYPLSVGVRENDNGIYSVGNVNSMEDACYREYKQTEQNLTLSLRISMIDEMYGGNDPIIIDAVCDAGYWLEDKLNGYYYSGDNEYACSPVGTEYYSTDGNGRVQCPTYLNPDSELVAGHTTGYGDGADDITDCAIPESVVYADSTGNWVYSGGCNYSK